MSNESTEETAREQSTSKQIGRLQGVRGHIEEYESKDYSYLDLPGLYESDPEAQTPYIISGTFIPEEIGGNVTVINDDEESNGNLGQENLNQMLSSFLPGGYKQRWGDFDLWRGAWHHETQSGYADVGPMFEWQDSFPLTELIGSVTTVDYTELPFDPDSVRVYIPLTVRVTMESKNNTDYVWIPEKGIVWTGDPPMQSDPLSSDPTTNYLWFKHLEGSFDSESESIEDADIISGFSFDDERQFIRCYYASLLTLYPEDSQKTRSEIIRYRCEDDETNAFVASRERSQLLTFELDRNSLRSRIRSAFKRDPHLERDIRVAFLRTKIWKELFFNQQALESVFDIEPLVEHLLGIDYWRRIVDNKTMGVFSLSGADIADEIQRLLPEDSSRHLRLLGYEGSEASQALKTIETYYDPVARLLAECRNETRLLDFAEQICVHSTEHALSTWSNDLTGTGTAFELWYDVTFQETDDDIARVAVYDPIQGGAGVAKEVHGQLQEGSQLGVETGLAAQGRCHSAASDRATIELLGTHPSGTLYDIYHNNHDQFVSLVESRLSEVVADFTYYSKEDLLSRVEQRTRTLFETRELASFYSYVASEHLNIEETIGRVPRIVDLALHLDRHVFTDPRIKTTYDRFADDSGRRDIAELGERLGELTVQCVTACPDCLKTDSTVCLHGIEQQEAYLNRRLLAEVFDE